MNNEQFGKFYAERWLLSSLTRKMKRVTFPPYETTALLVQEEHAHNHPLLALLFQLAKATITPPPLHKHPAPKGMCDASRHKPLVSLVEAFHPGTRPLLDKTTIPMRSIQFLGTSQAI